MAPLTPNDRQRRILQLAHEWGIQQPPRHVQLARPPYAPSFRTPQDEQAAEDLLQRRAVEAAQVRPRSGLSRAFSSNNLKRGKNADPAELAEALSSVVASGGSPGVAEALLTKISAAGVDLTNPVNRSKSAMLSRRKSMDSFVDRTRLLRLATENQQPDMLSVLLPYADPLSLDICVPIAVRQGNAQTAELLLRYGANLGESAEGQDAFRQASQKQGASFMISLVLSSDGRPSTQLLSQSLIDAVAVGDLESVIHLTRSAADANYNQAEPLKTAVRVCRSDLVLAIITGNKPPQVPGVNEAFALLTDNTNLPPNAKLQMAELLLCAGASGEVVTKALRRAWDGQFLAMATLLASYGASTSDQFVLKDAIVKEQSALVESLLSGSTISPALASDCVSFIPKQTTPELRVKFLKLLLKCGASGDPLHETLISATEAADAASVGLLLKPFIRERERTPGNGQENGHVNGNGTSDPAFVRHAVASVDYKTGEALRTAVLRSDTDITKLLLEGRPSQETLATIFPLTSRLEQDARYKMVDLFLQGALSGPSLHAALQEALESAPESRDTALIQLLLHHSADINYRQGAGLRRIIIEGDMKLLSILLQKASPQTAAARIPDVMNVMDHRCRYEMMDMLLKAGAIIGTHQVAEALQALLKESPVDMSLLRLLLQSGDADINALEGSIIKHAVRNPDPKVLELIVSLGKPSSGSISLALVELGPLPSTDGKTWKLNIITSKSVTQEDLNSFLVNEVDSVVQNRSRNPSLSTLTQALQSGADPNAYKGVALHHAVRSADSQITDMILSSSTKPTPASLASAFPHVLRIADPMDRLAFSKRLIEAGADSAELNRALQHAINKFSNDLSLLSVLASAADGRDGETLSLAVTKESPDIVGLILSRTEHTLAARDVALQNALIITDRGTRRKICAHLLEAGTSAAMASKALLVAAKDGDLQLSDALMRHGATMSDKDGQPIIEACRSGSADVLEVLLKANQSIEKAALQRGFQAATEVGDLSKRAVVFEKLLKRGVTGDILDMQLGSAARYGENGHELLRVLLEAGADPNYNDGDAIVASTRSAFVGNLELLLGLWDESKKQKRASGPTLLRSFKAAWKLNSDTRLHIVDGLINAGLPLGEDVHIALSEAVSEEQPDVRIVKLLLEHGASCTANSCKALIDATRTGSEELLSLLLKKDISYDDLSYVFAEAFAAEDPKVWLTTRGLGIARSYICRGVRGGTVSEPLVAAMKATAEDNGDSHLAKQFVELFLSAAPDVNSEGGKPLQVAASCAKDDWISRMLELHPSKETLTFAFQRIFDTALPEDEALSLFSLFADHQDGETRIDVTIQQPGVEPTLVRAMRSYPRRPMILETLLNAGFYHDQTTRYKLHDDVEEEEEVTLLLWAIAQPQKKISSSLIEVLLSRGANANSDSSLSRTTPLMMAIQTRQPDVVRLLLLAGAEVDVCDYREQTPLAMATAIGGEVGTTMMISLLAAGPSVDDGSLHNAARDLNMRAVKALIENGHHPDFPSSAHNGRSALGEVCLRGSDAGETSFTRETTMQKVMSLLIEEGSDLSVKSHGKSLLHLCSESRDPVTTTRILLKAGMWKHINKPFNHYTDGTHTYSPTMYVSKCLPPSPTHTELLALLRSNRGQDVYYANSGPQPDDAIGLPEDMEVAERTRRARVSRLAEEDEDFRLTLARRKELASVEQQIQAEKAEMEDMRRRRLHSEDLSSVRARAQLSTSLEESAFQRKLGQQNRLAEQASAHARAAAQHAQEAEDVRSRRALEYEGRLNTEKVGNARALTQLRLREREEVDRIERRAEERIKGRLDAQKKLVDGQERLARRLAEGGVGADQRRQIGFVEEVHGTP